MDANTPAEHDSTPAEHDSTELFKVLTDPMLDILREAAHAERRDLVNLYTEADRKQKIADLDRVIGLIEEEQAKRAGFASSDDLISALGGFEFVQVQDADHLAYLLDVDEDEKAPVEVTSEVNGYEVIGTIEAKHVWRVATSEAMTKVAYQSGTHVVTGAPRWTEVKSGQDVTGLDLYEIV